MKLYSDNILTKSRWWRRLRYGRGHGIHSPYAYEMVQDLLQPRYPYYEEVLMRSHAHAQLRSNPGAKDFLDEELALLWFRVVARFAPDGVVLHTPAYDDALYYTGVADSQCPILPKEEVNMPDRLALLTDDPEYALNLCIKAESQNCRLMVMLLLDGSGRVDRLVAETFLSGIKNGIALDAYNVLLYTNKNKDLYIYRSTL